MARPSWLKFPLLISKWPTKNTIWPEKVGAEALQVLPKEAVTHND
jgi:hypothetical protein